MVISCCTFLTKSEDSDISSDDIRMKSGAAALVEDEPDLPDKEIESESSEEQPAFPIDVEDAPSDDSSDEEVLLWVGKIPLRWYDDYEHAGYTVTGDKVAKKESDQLDEFLRR